MLSLGHTVTHNPDSSHSGHSSHQLTSTAETHEQVSSFTLHFQMQWHFLHVLASSFLSTKRSVLINLMSTHIRQLHFQPFLRHLLRHLHLVNVSKLALFSLVTQTRHPDQ